MADLTIKINGDVKNYKSALEQAESQTADLGNSLSQIGKVSAVAFAALTGEVLFASKAFAESQAASNKLTQALQNQGIYSSELVREYGAMAKAIQDKTGLDDDSVVAAQASIQAMIGQTKITPQLTQAIADLSAAKQMDLTTTAELIGKGIQGHVGALQKLGIEIDEHLSKEERTARIIELVGQKFGGQAEAANKGLGALKGLQSAFGDLQEEIGGRFAPIIEAAIRGMTTFITTIANNQPLMDFVTASIAAGTVVAALGTTVGIAGTAFLGLKTILTAVGATMSVTRAAAIALGSATGIGLIAFAVAELALNWGTVWPKMQAVFQAFVANVTGLANGVGNVLGGMLNFSPSQVKAGMDQVKTAVQTGYAEIAAAVKPINVGATESKEGQDSGKAEAAEAEAAKEVETERNKQALLAAERDLALLKLEESSAQEIAIAQGKVETLKALQTQTDTEIKEALYAHLAEIQAIEDEASAISDAQETAYREELLAKSAEFQALDAAQQALFIQQNSDKLRQSLETDKSIKLQYAQQQLQADIQRRNQFLIDEQKFGIAYATINQAMHSSIYGGAKDAFGELAQLQNSKSKELKAIGKAAAVANITIATAESAMKIYAGFAAIPIVGPALGIAGAAAAIAFGAERIGQVVSAADGGIITGGIPGLDSVPAMLMPGELVVPTRNFEETVSAVANQRAGIVQNQESNGGVAEIVLTLRDDLVDFIEARLVERQRLNISVVGA